MTCLFVGNLIKGVSESKMTSVFREHGRCRVELKGPYAFVEYDDAESAVNALKELNKSTLKGANGSVKARIEFAHKRKKNDKLETNDVIEEYALEVSEDESYKRSDSHRKRKNSVSDEEDNNFRKRNVCFICKLPGHFAKDCVLTKESCYECGERGHIAKECTEKVRDAKNLTENRVKAIFSQQSSYKFISAGNKIRNVINYLNSKMMKIDS